jgi:hypothetical protein
MNKHFSWVLNQRLRIRRRAIPQTAFCVLAIAATLFFAPNLFGADTRPEQTVNGVPGVALVSDAATGTILIHEKLNGKAVYPDLRYWRQPFDLRRAGLRHVGG